MTWTAQQRRKSRSEYQRLYASNDARSGRGIRPLAIPANVRREIYHEPCIRCGASRECKHRPAPWMFGGAT